MTKNCLKGMLKIISALLLFLLAYSSQAQVGQSYWKYVNPKTFGFNVNDIDFVDNNNGIAVGFGGGIAKTTDGGQTWQYGAFTFIDGSNTVRKPTFEDVHYVTPMIAYAVGNNGVFAKTTDGGLNWVNMDNPFTNASSSSQQAYAVWFTSTTTGYIGGTEIAAGNNAPDLYKTTDGGLNWTAIAAPLGDSTFSGPRANPVTNQITSINKTIYAIKFVNDSIGFVTGSGSSAPFGTASAMLWKYRSGVLTDYSVSKEKLYPQWNQTTGTNYSNYTPCSQNYRAMQPVNDSLILMASQNNAIVFRVGTGVNDKTADFVHPGEFVNGKYEIVHYSAIPGLPVVLPTFNMWNMVKAPNGTVYVTQGNAQLGFTTDNGTTWNLTRAFQPPSNLSGFLFSGVDITPNGKIIAAGKEGVIADSIPGASWHSNYQNYKTSGGSLNKMEFADCDNGIGVGGFGNISVTTDGGNTWVDKTVPAFAASNISMFGMSYPNPNLLYFGTSNGNVYSSVDKGTTIDLLFSAPSIGTTGTTIYGVASKGNRIWAMGRRNNPINQTYVFRSMNAGATWDTIIPYPSGTTSSSINYIFFATPDTGYIIGSRSKIYKTTNAGTNWVDVSPPLASAFISFTDMAILSKDTVYACGSGRTVVKSFDGGTTWTEVTINLTNPSQFVGNLGAIIMHDSKNGYVMSNSGTSLLTNDGGVTWIPQNAPSTGIFGTAAFVPTTVPAGTPFANRKVIVASTPNHFFEYGNPLTININSSEAVTPASCTNPTGGSITINASGGIAPYTYSINGTTFQSSNMFTGLSQGTKTITIKESACGRTITKMVTVGFTDNMTVTASNDTTVCAGAPVQLNAIAPAGTTFTWSPSTGLSATNIRNPIATANNNTTYTVTATLGSCVKTDNVVITIKPNPIVNAGPDKTIVDGDQVLLSGSSNSTPASIAWTPASSIVSGISTFAPLVKPNVTTTYTMTVRNLEGCTSTDNAVVTVIPYCVKVMNAFTPNGDGQNDRWLVTNGAACTSKISVTVFNRYGGKVYQNDNYQNNWEGTYDGKSIADGTYYYVIIYRLINGQTLTMKGDVTILR